MNGEVGEEKWVKHYSSNHQILLVGEGDFSFSLCLALSFGSASNIVASSLDSYEVLIKKYKSAETNLEMLYSFGAQLLHGVDLINMKLHTDLRMRKFDRIVYNFPHTDFPWKRRYDLVTMKHKNLVHGFVKNACGLLRPNGEIHVTLKTERRFQYWNIKELATQCGLTLLECVDFKLEDYPVYNNKRGDAYGIYSDQPFPLGKCSTFKFIISPKAIKSSTSSHHRNPQQPAMSPIPEAEFNMNRVYMDVEMAKKASRMVAVEEQAKKMHEELELYKPIMSGQEEKIMKVKSELEDARREIVVAVTKIVELESDKFVLQKKLHITSGQLEEKEDKYKLRVADLEWLLQIGIPSIIWRLLRSSDFVWENAMIQSACADLGYQKGCQRMRDMLAPDMLDCELPEFDPDVEKNMKVAHFALAEAKLNIMNHLTQNGVNVVKLKKWCEEDLE